MGTWMLGSTARTSHWPIRRMIGLTIPGLIASRSSFPNQASFSGSSAMLGAKARMRSPVPQPSTSRSTPSSRTPGSDAHGSSSERIVQANVSYSARAPVRSG